MLKDFERILGARAWINEHVEKTKEDYIQEISANGFKFLREEKIPFRENFQLTFQKN